MLPVAAISKDMNMMALNKTLCSIILEQDAGEVCGALLFYEYRGSKREAGMPGKESVQRSSAGRSRKSAIEW